MSSEEVVDNLRALPSADEDESLRVLWARFLHSSSSAEFQRSWLALQCRWIPGVEAAILLAARRSGTLEPVASWPADAKVGQSLASAAERTLKKRQPLVLRVAAGGRAEEGEADCCLLTQPVEARRELVAIVALQLPRRSQEELDEASRRLTWGCAWLELAIERRRLRVAAPRGEQVGALLDVLAAPLEHERFKASATSFATELATQLDCARVAVGFAECGRLALRALSHSAQFGKRSNLTRAIEAAMEEALDQEGTVSLPHPRGAPIRITRAHEALAAEGGSGAICSVLLAHGAEHCGAVLLERDADEPFQAAEIELLEAAAALAGPLLEVLRRDDRWLHAKARESAGDFLGRLFGPRHTVLKLGAAAVLALLLFMALVKGDYRVTADAVVEGRVMLAAVAPFDGYIGEASIRAGDVVGEGDLLAQLDDRKLLLERARLSGQREQLLKQHRQALALRDVAKARIVDAQLDQARAELGLVEDRLARTRITAPFDGVVVKGDLSQRLGAPVETGEVLFEVAPLHDYRVVLEVDEHDIDEVAVGQAGQLLLTSMPADPLPISIEKITPSSTAWEGKNTFRVEANTDQGSDRLRPGMEGAAKVVVGRRHLLWIWTHEVIDWLRLVVWNWMP